MTFNEQEQQRVAEAEARRLEEQARERSGRGIAARLKGGK